MTGQLRAAIYARFSTDMQRDDSIDDQMRSCRDYAARQGLTVVETYSDRAISGASLMRSGIQKLMRDARAGGFDIVVSEALDRLSRNQADIAQIYQTLGFISRDSVAKMMAFSVPPGYRRKAALKRPKLDAFFHRDHRRLAGR